MSVSQILDVNGKISENYLPSNAGGVPTLAEVLNEDNDGENLFINNLGGLELSNGAGVGPAIATLTAQYVPGTNPGTGNVLNVEDKNGDLCDIQVNHIYLGGPSVDIKFSTQNGTDPAGNTSEILNITDYSNGTACINCASAFIGDLQIQNGQNVIYFLQNLNTGAVGATAGRIPVICGGTTYYLQVYASP